LPSAGDDPLADPRYRHERAARFRFQHISTVEVFGSLGPSGNSPNPQHEKLIHFVTDRPGHDARYAIDASKIRHELGWQPGHTFDNGLRDTVRWFLEHKVWWERIMSGAYRGERLGLPG
jgi:dTDP-D-glucose 4,6-dehydratase